MKNLTLVILSLATVAMMGCGQKMTKDSNNTSSGIAASNNISLEKDFQEIVHYDCNHHVTSDAIGMVSSPTQWITIDPNDWSNIGGSKFTNQATGSTAPFVSDYTTFQVDYGNGDLTMHVNAGVNIIKYWFYSCDKRDAAGTCILANTIKETGTVTINVTYSEKTLPGKLEVNDCATPTPAPAH